MLQPVAAVGHEVDSRLWHVSWSRSGRYLASCGEDKMIKIWGSNSNDWSTPNHEIECIATLEEAQARTIRCCEWSPNDKMLASASFDGTVVVWEAQGSSMTVWEQIATLEGHENEVKSVDWSCDGRWLATCGRDKKVWIWEIISGAEFECVAILDGHTQDVKFVKWHPTSPDVLMTASYDDTIRVWKEDNDDWYCAATLTGHASTVWGISFSLAGNKMVSVSDDRNLIEWECESSDGKSQWRSSGKLLNLHDQAIYSCDWSHTNGFVATASGDNDICLCFCVGDGEKQLSVSSRMHSAHENDVNCVRWNPSEELGDHLASTGDDGLLKIWRLAIM